jgi:hypothetical protein
VVPNLYSLLAQTPPDAQYYSVLDLKDAFFCIPLHPDSQLLFAFEDPTKPAEQLTWMVLPQGFPNSLNIFGQTLPQDLMDWQFQETTLFQYVDDFLFCGPTEPLSPGLQSPY